MYKQQFSIELTLGCFACFSRSPINYFSNVIIVTRISEVMASKLA